MTGALQTQLFDHMPWVVSGLNLSCCYFCPKAKAGYFVQKQKQVLSHKKKPALPAFIAEAGLFVSYLTVHSAKAEQDGTGSHTPSCFCFNFLLRLLPWREHASEITLAARARRRGLIVRHVPLLRIASSQASIASARGAHW